MRVSSRRNLRPQAAHLPTVPSTACLMLSSSRLTDSLPEVARGDPLCLVRGLLLSALVPSQVVQIKRVDEVPKGRKLLHFFLIGPSCQPFFFSLGPQGDASLVKHFFFATNGGLPPFC